MECRSQLGYWCTGVGTEADIHASGPALIEAGVEAVATGSWSRWGTGDVDPTVLDMTGGSLTLNGLALGGLGGPATVNINGGTVSTSGHLVIGDQDGGDTTLNINGGTVNIGGDLAAKENATTNSINLNSGVVTASNISLYDSDGPVDPNGTTLDIEAGTLILDGDDTTVVRGYIDAGLLTAYDDTGTVLVNLDDADPDAITTTVTACALRLEADLTGDCAVDIDDLELVAADWLYKTLNIPDTEEAWSFDMATDPVGTGDYELVVRGADNNYTMTNDTGTGTLHVTGAGTLLLDSQEPVHDREHDATINFVVKSTSVGGVHLWFTMELGTRPGGYSYCGISINAAGAGGTQNVELWTGEPPHRSEYTTTRLPVLATGFAAGAYMDITVNYDHGTDTFDWVINDGVTAEQSGTGEDYASTRLTGAAGKWTIHSQDSYGTTAGIGSALIDQLDVTIYHTGVQTEDSAADVQPDGSVDLLDFAAIALEWMRGI
ncbi:MAG TPA: hypothetical protein ENH94_05590 [Phycisphaerales bacterium]|nr:hypothetical protein [Phycisphaerales bacterium]